jgi:hypothetical protein
MKRGLFSFILAFFLWAVVPACADEGMWLFNAFPREKVQAKYGFEPSQQWLDAVRLGSVRFNNGGSGSFVSPDGLTFTNHHVGAICVQQLSTPGHDYIKEGFYAKTQAEEARCPDLELNQLVEIEDVTTTIEAAAKPGMSPAEAGRAQRAAMSRVEKECAGATGLRCDVVTLYSGEIYNLYKYKKYTDVRLVFAPEFDAAFFGGDPDNFTYPRYDLDITFFRVYENGKPAHTEHYLAWSSEGVRDHELIFVSGNPGSTGRLKTITQLKFLRDLDYPARLETYKRRIALLLNFGAQSEENARIAKEELFSYQNSFKALSGYLVPLENKAIMAGKQAEEARLEAAFRANPRNESAANPWAEIADAMKVQSEIYLPLSYLERLRGFNSELAYYARWIVRGTEEKTKPNEDRLREYRDSALPSLEQNLFSTAPIYKALDTVTFADSLAQMRDVLGADNPVVKKVLNGRTPEEAAKDIIGNTKLDDVGVRKQLYAGGPAAVKASTDPMIVLLRAIDAGARSVRKEYDDKVEAVERSAGAAIARAKFAHSGFTQPPDATFTLRLSYGAVKGYTENGRKIPYFTDFAGGFQHAADHNNLPPYQLPARWMQAKDKLDLGTPLDFVSTADIIGGNSGSPTLNRKGEVVGIVFDGNMQSLAWNFVYEEEQARAVHVDSGGILEALQKIYGATGLVEELTNKKPAGVRQ